MPVQRFVVGRQCGREGGGAGRVAWQTCVDTSSLPAIQRRIQRKDRHLSVPVATAGDVALPHLVRGGTVGGDAGLVDATGCVGHLEEVLDHSTVSAPAHSSSVGT
jgi:hypothetical protein